MVIDAPSLRRRAAILLAGPLRWAGAALLGGALGIASSQIILPMLGSSPPTAEEVGSLDERQACAEYGLALQGGAELNPHTEAWCRMMGRTGRSMEGQRSVLALRAAQ
jgi:hypothetical protein